MWKKQYFLVKKGESISREGVDVALKANNSMAIAL